MLISDVLPGRLKLADSLGLRPIAAGDELKATVMELTQSNGADLLSNAPGIPLPPAR